MANDKFTNLITDGEVADNNPDCLQDYYLHTDKRRDDNYLHYKNVEAIKALSNSIDISMQIIQGGIVSDSGSGQIDISEGWAIGKDTDGNERLLHLPAQSNISLPSGWDDGRQIWVASQADYKFEGTTRDHWNGDTYHYILQETHDGDANAINKPTNGYFYDSDPGNTDYIVWGSFTMTGTTFADLSWGERNREFRAKQHFYKSLTAYSGGGQANAYQLKFGMNIFTTVAASNDSAKLPSVFYEGDVVEVVNSGSKIMAIYPASGDNIESLSANVAITLLPGCRAKFQGNVDNTSWFLIEGKIQESVATTLTVSYVSGGTSWTTRRAIGVMRNEPLSGVLILKNIKIVGYYGSSTSSGSGKIAITGIVCKNVTNYYPPLNGDNGGANWQTGQPSPNSNQVVIWAGSNYTDVRLSGEIELESQTLF